MKSVYFETFTRLGCSCRDTVVICLDTTLTATAAPFILGTIAAIDSVLDSHNRELYRYTFLYDEAQLLDINYTLLPCDIGGAFCKSCLTDYIDYRTTSDSWKLLGNAGTVDGINFIGTTDDVAHDVRVNNMRVRRSQPDLITPTIVDGNAANTIDSGLSGCAVLSGGGDSNTDDNGSTYDPNSITVNHETDWNHYSVICGGAGNVIAGDENGWSGLAAIVGGLNNNIRREHKGSFIGAGNGNQIVDGIYSSIVGGTYHTITALYDQAGGIIQISDSSAILGGDNNEIDGSFTSVVIGGSSHHIFGSTASIICGGEMNQIGTFPYTDEYIFWNFIGVGSRLTIEKVAESAVLSGEANHIYNTIYAATMATSLRASVILGGIANTIEDGGASTILGGVGLKLGLLSLGYQAAEPNMTPHAADIYTHTDLTAFDHLAYFGDVDIWVGNITNSASKVKFFEPNTDVDYSSTNYSSFEAQAQSANIEYKLPAAAGVAGQVLKIQGVVGSVVTLEWANDNT